MTDAADPATATRTRGGDEPFATAVRSRRWLLGSVVSSPDPVLTERIAQWFDFIWIDLEHSALGVCDAQLLAIAARAGGASALVRVARSDTELLGAILDSGVDGVVAPRIESALDAERLVRAMRYPPHGTRGFAPRRSTAGRAVAGRRTGLPGPACLVQIESQRGLANVDAIAATAGVDGLIVGTADLSFDLGSPLNMHSRELMSALSVVREAAARSGKAWGVALGEFPDWMHELRKDEASLLVFSSDIRIYSEALERCAERLRELERGAARTPESRDGAATLGAAASLGTSPDDSVRRS